MTTTNEIQKSILELLRNARDAYGKLNEAEQRDVIAATGAIAQRAVKKAIDDVTAAGQETLDVVIHQVKINKDTIEAKISIDRDDPKGGHLKNAAYGTAKLLFVNDASALLDLGDQPLPNPDQPVMFTDDPEAAIEKWDDRPRGEMPPPPPPKRKRGRPKKEASTLN